MTEQNPTTTTYEIERQERLTTDGGGHVLAWVHEATEEGESYSARGVFRAWVDDQDDPVAGSYRVVSRYPSGGTSLDEFDVNLVTSVEIERVEHRHDQLARDIAALSEAGFDPAPTSDEG